jgi:hypothetical protein
MLCVKVFTTMPEKQPAPNTCCLCGTCYRCSHSQKATARQQELLVLVGLAVMLASYHIRHAARSRHAWINTTA